MTPPPSSAGMLTAEPAGIIHDNGVRMTATPTGRSLLRFAITFLMSWKIWTDVTQSLSWFEADDILTRVKMLFEIACLLACVFPPFLPPPPPLPRGTRRGAVGADERRRQPSCGSLPTSWPSWATSSPRRP